MQSYQASYQCPHCRLEMLSWDWDQADPQLLRGRVAWLLADPRVQWADRSTGQEWPAGRQLPCHTGTCNGGDGQLRGLGLGDREVGPECCVSRKQNYNTIKTTGLKYGMHSYYWRVDPGIGQSEGSAVSTNRRTAIVCLTANRITQSESQTLRRRVQLARHVAPDNVISTRETGTCECDHDNDNAYPGAR